MIDLLILTLALSGVAGSCMAVLGGMRPEGGPVHAMAGMRRIGKAGRLPMS